MAYPKKRDVQKDWMRVFERVRKRGKGEREAFAYAVLKSLGSNCFLEPSLTPSERADLVCLMNFLEVKTYGGC